VTSLLLVHKYLPYQYKGTNTDSSGAPKTAAGASKRTEEAAGAGGAAQVEPAKGRQDIASSDPQMDSFFVKCDPKKLKGAGVKVVKLGPYKKDVTFGELCKSLAKHFSLKVFFQYQTFEAGGALGPVVKVDCREAFEQMLAYIQSDAAAADPAHAGTLDIELYEKKELDEVRLRFKRENVTVVLDFDATWEEAQVC
jgi:hypothetical protein